MLGNEIWCYALKNQATQVPNLLYFFSMNNSSEFEIRLVNKFKLLLLNRTEREIRVAVGY